MKAQAEQIKKSVDRAKEVLARANIANKAQYTHGINSTSASIEYTLKNITKCDDIECSDLEHLHQKTMQLAGYLYALTNNL